MPLISTLARLEAVRTGRAQPAATVLHRHLSARPLVLVPLTTAGEAGAPLGALVGTDRDAPRLLVVPQPADRELRFTFLARLASVVLPYIEEYAAQVEPAERTEADPETGKRVKVVTELCADAPQLVVPGRAGIELVRLLGRANRFRRTAEEDPEGPYPAPEQVPLLARWFTHLGERARVPGSSLLVAMTDLLARHWATGQSALEDQHLGALLAWIDPPAGDDGDRAARHAELARDEEGQLLCPPAGPATDPAFDNKLLAPAVERYDRARRALADAQDGESADRLLAATTAAERELRALVESRTRPTWDAVWRGIDLLRELPEGAHVTDRWTRDRWSFTAHRDRLAAGEPPQPRRDDAVTAAQKLATREREQARLDAQEALDDPLVMAGRRLAGEAFAAEVLDVRMTYTESKRPSPRPVLTVRTEDAPHAAPGTKVYRELDGRPQSAEVLAPEEVAEADPEAGAELAAGDGAGPGERLLLLRVLDRMGRGREPEEGSVPEKGDRICWTLFEHDQRGGPRLPDPEETPWTHGGPPEPPGALPGPATAPDPVTPEDLL
ncbi:hypothetical protein ACPCK9_09605 [Streptomyces koyangensis]|uniref:hypothetical protein n=1 Tax=Streptomyces koyangensis TaxID=188770 RepID=UPI003C2D099D